MWVAAPWPSRRRWPGTSGPDGSGSPTGTPWASRTRPTCSPRGCSDLPVFLRGIAGWEIKGVFTLAGWLLALAALAARRPIRDFAVAWYAAIVRLLSRRGRHHGGRLGVVLPHRLGGARLPSHGDRLRRARRRDRGPPAAGRPGGEIAASRSDLGGITLAALTATTVYALWLREVRPDEKRFYDCARMAAARVPPGAWLLVRGGVKARSPWPSRGVRRFPRVRLDGPPRVHLSGRGRRPRDDRAVRRARGALLARPPRRTERRGSPASRPASAGAW